MYILKNNVKIQSFQVEKMKMRARVEELFSETTMVTCGLVTERTRISFRSATAQVKK